MNKYDDFLHLIIEHYAELLELTKKGDVISHEDEKIRAIIEENNEELPSKVINLAIDYVNSTVDAHLSKCRRVQIADNISQIRDLLPQIQSGNEDILANIIDAFSLQQQPTLLHLQCAMTFCSLINPTQFPRFDKAVLSCMCVGRDDLSQFLHSSIFSNVSDCFNVATLVKGFYDAIKDNVQDCSYSDIHSILFTIWQVLTDYRVINAVIQGTIRCGLDMSGLPDFLSAILAKLVSLGVDQYLRPQLEKYRKQHFKNSNKRTRI